MTVPHNLKNTGLDPATLGVAAEALEKLPLPELLSTCHEHTARFRRGAENDPRYCLELFRRAIDAHDPEAWHGLINLYRPLLIARLQQRGVAPALAEDAVQDAFVTLWLNGIHGKFSTQDRVLAQVLNYLWSSVRFALVKLHRQQRTLPLADVPESAYTTVESEAIVERALDAQALLIRVRGFVSEHEWQILQLRFVQEIPPREIALLLDLPVKDIHTLLANVKRRLRADPALRAAMDVESSSLSQ